MESEHEENVGNSVHQINFETDMKPEESTIYDTISNDIIQEDQEESIEDNEEEEIVYEAYEISDLPAPNIQTIQTQNQQNHPKINLLRQNNQTHTLIQQQQQQQQDQQQTQSTIVQNKQQIQQQQATIIPVTLSGTSDDHSSADLNFFLALLPDIKMMRLDQKRKLRIEILQLIDRILNN